jgi:hypothetical protein
MTSNAEPLKITTYAFSDTDYRDYLIELALLDERHERESSPLYPSQTTAYCGPTAMAAVTGEPISVIEDAIRRASGKIAKPVRGVNHKHLLAAMELLGWHVVEEGGESVRYTLDAFAKDHGHDGPFIVAVTDHYVAISEFCDTTMILPCDLFSALDQQRWWCKRIGSTWVHSWWRFERGWRAAYLSCGE